MEVIKLSVEQVDPGQVPVIAFEQPLFALSSGYGYDQVSTERISL